MVLARPPPPAALRRRRRAPSATATGRKTSEAPRHIALMHIIQVAPISDSRDRSTADVFSQRPKLGAAAAHTFCHGQRH